MATVGLALPTSGTLDLIGAAEPLDLSVGALVAENQSYTILPLFPMQTVRFTIAPVNTFGWNLALIRVLIEFACA